MKKRDAMEYIYALSYAWIDSRKKVTKEDVQE